MVAIYYYGYRYGLFISMISKKDFLYFCSNFHRKNVSSISWWRPTLSMLCIYTFWLKSPRVFLILNVHQKHPLRYKQNLIKYCNNIHHTIEIQCWMLNNIPSMVWLSVFQFSVKYVDMRSRKQCQTFFKSFYMRIFFAQPFCAHLKFYSNFQIYLK